MMFVMPGAFTRVRAALRTRAALGMGPATIPVMLFVPLGALLGPAGTGLLPTAALARLDVVISIALATLGVFVGIAAGTRRRNGRRLVAAAAVEAGTTALVVAGAVIVLLQAWQMPAGFSPWLIAGALGVAAAASAAPADPESDVPHTIAATVADLDDVMPILAGAFLLSAFVSGADRLLLDIALTAGAGAAVGIAGWLLFDTAEEAERGVFVMGTLALLGGCAAYLGSSPLLAGVVAGAIWARTPGHTDRIAADDLRKVQHPLVVLLLLAAGAGLQPTTTGVWLFAPYVFFRLSGKLIGGWGASRLVPGVAPSDLGSFLIAPGVLGLAFILNLQQVTPDLAGPLVFAVTAGAAVSELIAVMVAPLPRASR